MGVRLDWEIEDERVADRELSESPRAARRRRTRRMHILLAVLVVGGAVFAIVGGILARLWYVDFEIRRQLRDTVAAETAALRIGDIAAFLYVQRSESDAWMLGQTNTFWQYQQLKQDHTVDLSGNILDMAVDESRGRVLVEEVIDGQRYRQVWFYWRYGDGWRHVPDDVTFWGEQERQTGGNFALEYGDLDKPMADALAPAIARLWEGGCQWLACSAPPPALVVRIIPDPAVGVSWDPEVPGLLRIASPLTGRASEDFPLDMATARQVGTLLSARLLQHAQGGMTPETGTDAAFLHKALQDWLIGRFLGDGGALGSSFMESLARAYGEQAVSLLTHALQPDSSIALLATTLGVPLDALPVDWREFFQWRLALEPFLLNQGDHAGVSRLYDDLAQAEAAALLSDPSASARPVPTVLRVMIGPGSDGASRAWAVVQYPDGSEGPITFRLVDGEWKRSIPDPAYAAVSP